MIYAIGDIHGQFDLLKRLYDLIIEDISLNGDEDNKIIFLGDYIDRGQQNRKVLDFIVHLQNTTKLEHIFLRGNHEQIFTEAMYYHLSKDKISIWVSNGGLNFMHEVGCYEFKCFHEVFPWGSYIRWFENNLQKYHETEDYIFVHGGLDIRQNDMNKQYLDYVMWARHSQKDWYGLFHKMVIHGHTPNDNAVIDKNRINVDTSGWNREVNGRKLTAVALQNRLVCGEPKIISVQQEEI